MISNRLEHRTSISCVLIVLVFFSIGCSPPRTVEMHTLTDPQMTLPEPDAALVHVAVVRVKHDADEPEPMLIERDRLTLSERDLLASVERGVRDAGFHVIARSEAEFILFCSSQVIRGQREVMRRVPIHETTVGSVHTRRGWRTFHGTTTTEVVVPEIRAFADRIITITVHHTVQDDEWPKPDDESAVWMGRIVGSEADLEDVVVPAVANLLGSWGRTERRRVRVNDLAGAK